MKKDNFFKKYVNPFLRHRIFSLLLLLIAMIVMFSVWSNAKGGSFFQMSTLRNILNSIVLSAFLAIGAGCLLISGNLDLSIAAVGAFGGMVLAMGIVRLGLPTFVAMLISLIVCGLLGAFNATMVTKFRFPAFIATLAMTSMSRGAMYIISSIGNPEGPVATHINVNFNNIIEYIGQGTIFTIGRGDNALAVPFGVVIVLIFFVFYGLLITKSKFGLKMMMVGGNPTAATLAGINSKRISYILFINASLLGGVAGIFSTARLGQASLLALQTNQYTGITAAILGGISFGGGAGGMGGVFVGLLILMSFQIGMSTVGVNPYWVNVLSGVILLLALTLDFLNQKRAVSVKAS
jgi:ribose/xylose/arabinose/galactoside ABC-type transport system permease subunit